MQTSPYLHPSLNAAVSGTMALQFQGRRANGNGGTTIRFLFAFVVTCVLAASSAEGGQPADAEAEFLFQDVIEQTGLHACIKGIQAHAAAWGDVDNDGSIDLFVGAFYADLRGHKVYQAPGPPVPGRIYYNRNGKFIHDPRSGVAIKSDCTGAVFVDFDNDGDLDFYVSNYRPREAGSNQFFENDGTGRFQEISRECGACPAEFTSRGIGVLDYDCDGLLDIFIVEGDRPVKHSRLYHNRGGLLFEETTEGAGLPPDISGLGVAVGDVTGSGWPDIFVAGQGSNRLFVNETGRFREVLSLRQVFRWESRNPTYRDDKPCGAAFGDVNRDGRLDLLVGQHYKAPWRYPERFRLFLNQGVRGDEPTFRDVSVEAGLEPLPSKAPHVEIRDFDNDGWPDLYTPIIVRTKERMHPVIYRNLGIRDGLPRFRQQSLQQVDFPTAEHRAMDVHQIVKTTPVRYFGVGPSTDFDGDGRLDLMLPAWWPSLPSLLLRNVTAADNNWLRVRVVGKDTVNRMGIGAKVCVYESGKGCDLQAIIGFQEIATGYGYASSQEAVAHFGLGKLTHCDVRVKLPGTLREVVRQNVPANQTLVIREEET